MPRPSPFSVLTGVRPPVFSPCLPPVPSLVAFQFRSYASQKTQKKPSGNKTHKKKRISTHFKPVDLSQVQQFSLLEAMRYIRAMEVGEDQHATKYELAVKLRTARNGPTIKSRIRLPVAVKTDMRICVIAEGEDAQKALDAGAVVVGKDDIFEKVRNGDINFDKVICHENCFADFNKAKLGRILGPKGMMPNPKQGTVTKYVADAVRDLTGKVDFREKDGVIRMAVGQLAFSEAQLAQNIKMFLEQLRKEFAAISFKSEKSINEVVLSSTHSAGFSLSGEIRASKKGEETQPQKEAEAAARKEDVGEAKKVPTEILLEGAAAPASPSATA
ncbi:ribosomal protein L1 [Ascodesmis nigricans]|uniref:Ribosomal protein L1 n=1 Tax=Ascodesmis nigricans TaxID=341454 RepID=A0A4V3SJ66_9PEZI|nr:ribosomal protein L1 [Ascodesmis nigricans]